MTSRMMTEELARAAGLAYARRPPSCRVTNSAAQAVADNSTTAVLTFDTERWDTGELHSTTTNTSRVTIRIPGRYRITGNAEYAANATGVRRLSILLNGSAILARAIDNAPSGTLVSVLLVTTEYELKRDDYIELQAYQNSGGNLNVNASANYSPEFTVTRIGDI